MLIPLFSHVITPLEEFPRKLPDRWNAVAGYFVLNETKIHEILLHMGLKCTCSHQVISTKSVLIWWVENFIFAFLIIAFFSRGFPIDTTIYIQIQALMEPSSSEANMNDINEVASTGNGKSLPSTWEFSMLVGTSALTFLIAYYQTLFLYFTY